MSFVKGLQEGEEDPKHLKIIATCKHYFAYDVDCAPQPPFPGFECGRSR